MQSIIKHKHKLDEGGQGNGQPRINGTAKQEKWMGYTGYRANSVFSWAWLLCSKRHRQDALDVSGRVPITCASHLHASECLHVHDHQFIGTQYLVFLCAYPCNAHIYTIIVKESHIYANH